jgi:hypothetical protein
MPLPSEPNQYFSLGPCKTSNGNAVVGPNGVMSGARTEQSANRATMLRPTANVGLRRATPTALCQMPPRGRLAAWNATVMP